MRDLKLEGENRTPETELTYRLFVNQLMSVHFQSGQSGFWELALP